MLADHFKPGDFVSLVDTDRNAWFGNLVAITDAGVLILGVADASPIYQPWHAIGSLVGGENARKAQEASKTRRSAAEGLAGIFARAMAGDDEQGSVN